DRPDRSLSLAIKLDKVVADDDGVVLVEGRDRVVDIDVLDPLVRLGPVERELDDGEEETPNEGILLAAGDLDAVNLLGSRLVALAAQHLSGEGHLRIGDLAGVLVEHEVDLEVEVRIAIQQRADAVLDLQL